MIKIAALCLWISGLGFGIPCIYGILSMLKGKGIAYVMGFPTYGNGPFEKIGVHTTIPLLIGFLFVCVLECIAGWGLWSGDKGAAILSFAIIPVEMVFFIGFALPFGPPFLLIRSLLLLFSWSSIN
jgi:hypothetical protein